MNNPRRRRLYAAVVVLFLCQSLATSQGPRDEIVPKGVVINNPTELKQIFYLKNGEKGEYLSFTLQPDSWMVYLNATHIQLWTNHTVSVEKPLEKGRKYDLYKNAKQNWDVIKN